MDLSIMVDLNIRVGVLSHQDILDTNHSSFNRESFPIIELRVRFMVLCQIISFLPKFEQIVRILSTSREDFIENFLRSLLGRPGDAS